MVRAIVDATPPPKSIDDLSERDRKYLDRWASILGMTAKEAFAALVKPTKGKDVTVLDAAIEPINRSR